MRDRNGQELEPGDHVRVVEGPRKGDVGVVFDIDDAWGSVRASMLLRRGKPLGDVYDLDCDGDMLERVRERPRVSDQTGEPDAVSVAIARRRRR